MYVSAADPGTEFPSSSISDDQKMGSVLFFPYYTSSAASPDSRDTQITLTNGNALAQVIIHVFFVSGSNGSIQDFVTSLFLNQTFVFDVSEFDPGVTGYMIVVTTASDGHPVKFNYLQGMARVRQGSGLRAGYRAESVAAIADPPTSWTGETQAALVFDGTNYNRLPRALAANGLRSAADGNSTTLVVIKAAGNSNIAPDFLMSSLGTITGDMYCTGSGEAGFTYSPGSPQIVETLSAAFPPMTPDYTSLIQSGRSGWMRLWSASDEGILGLYLNLNSSGGISTGQNLHKLSLSTTNTFNVPVFDCNC